MHPAMTDSTWYGHARVADPAAQISAFVMSDDLRAGEHVASHRILELAARGAVVEVEGRDVDGVQKQTVAAGAEPGGGAGTVVPDPVEVVLPGYTHALYVHRFGVVVGRGNVPHQPMGERPDASIRIIHDQGETLGSLGKEAPADGRRNVSALACVRTFDLRILVDGRTAQGESRILGRGFHVESSCNDDASAVVWPFCSSSAPNERTVHPLHDRARKNPSDGCAVEEKDMNLRITKLGWATLAAFVASGCEPTPPNTPPPPEPHIEAEPEATDARVERIDDRAIASAVGALIVGDANVKQSTIRVSSRHGIVELIGTVGTLLERARATQLAETVRGVRAVSNRLVVAPTSRSDETIEDDVRQRLILDPVAELFEVTPTVENGVVTLKGHAQSWPERAFAERAAMSVHGVRDVINQVAVVAMERPDQAIFDDVVGRLRWDAYVRDGRMTVSVRDGVVELTGYVGSAGEKTRAALIAHVAGVTRVDVDELEVRTWGDSPTVRNRKSIYLPDTDIAAALSRTLAADPRIVAFSIEPEVDAGVVVLEGVVDYLGARRIAAELAASTTGVVQVVNRIRVEPTTNVADAFLEDRIELALGLNPLTSVSDIDVAVERGRAHLIGTVDSFFEKIEAENVAIGLRGIRAVDNDLRVEALARAAWTALPTFPPGPAPSLTAVFVATGVAVDKTDAELESHIERALSINARVEPSRIDVEANDGRVTLRGTVPSLVDLHLTELIVYASGAARVTNQLVVERALAF